MKSIIPAFLLALGVSSQLSAGPFKVNVTVETDKTMFNKEKIGRMFYKQHVDDIPTMFWASSAGDSTTQITVDDANPAEVEFTYEAHRFPQKKGSCDPKSVPVTKDGNRLRHLKFFLTGLCTVFSTYE